MRVGIYAGGSHPVVTALREGFAAMGCKVAARASEYYRGEVENFDLVVSYGMRAGRRVRDAYRAEGVPVVVVDWGYMARVNVKGEYEGGHFQVGLDRLNAMPDFACPSDRFDALDVAIAAKGGDPNGYVLICGQVPGDAAHGMRSDQYVAWLRETVSKYPGAVYRKHPRGGVDLPGVESRTGSLESALAGARLVVTWNSNVGHDALLAGVPVIAHGPAAYADLSGETLPSLEDRLDYFHRVAYGQWTLDEMRSGACQRFILDHLLTGVGPALEGVRPDDAEAVESVAGIDVPLQPAVVPDLPSNDGLEGLDAERLHALARERGVRVHHKAGADKVRAALRGAA